MKHFIIASLFLSAALAGCSSKNGGANSSSGSSSSSITLRASSVGGKTYSGQTGYDAAFSYSCAGGVSGNTTLSAATLSLGSASPSSCTFTFNSMTYNGTTNTCDTSTTVSSANPAYLTPILVTCGSSFTLKIVTAGIFNTTTPTSKSIYATLISSTDFSLVPAGTAPNQKILPVVGTGDTYSCGLVWPGMSAAATSQIYCWGYNTVVFYQDQHLNSGSAYAAPTLMDTSSFTPKNLAVGEEILCAMDTSNNVWCLGNITQTPPTSFTQITGFPVGATPQKIVAGSLSACALTSASNNSLYCWGYVDFASPAGSGAYQTTPVEIGGFSGAISQFAISSDLNYGTYGALCAVVGSDSHVECAGSNLYGQLGAAGLANADTTYHTPASVVLADGTTPLTGVVSLSGNNATFCATTTTLAVYCWGAANNTPSLSFFQITSWYWTWNSSLAPTVAQYSWQGQYVDNNSNPYTPNFVWEPNFFGFLSVDDWSASGWPGGGYIFSNVGATAYNDFTSYLSDTQYSYTSILKYATLMPNLTLNTVSVGRMAICGTYNSNLYCYGADLTVGSMASHIGDPAPVGNPAQADRADQFDLSSIWQNVGANPYPIVNVVEPGWGHSSLWAQYAYGNMGTLTLSLSIQAGNTEGSNYLTSYTADTSTLGGGMFSLSSVPLSMSVGSNIWPCQAPSASSDALPGHACVVTADGAISCFGSNDCGQAGNGTLNDMITSPTAVLYPTGSGYSGGVGY